MLIPCWWFSFSDRICPGKDIAENTMWICIASIFYAFKITPELDKDGNPLPVDLEYEEFSVRYGGPFTCYCFCHLLIVIGSFCLFATLDTRSRSRLSSSLDMSLRST